METGHERRRYRTGGTALDVQRIDRVTVDPEFKVEMRARGQTARTDITDDLTLPYTCSPPHAVRETA